MDICHGTCYSHISSHPAELKQMLQPYFFLFGWTEADAAAIFLLIRLNWSRSCSQFSSHSAELKLQPYFFLFGWTEADAAAIFLPIWLNWSRCCSHISSYLAELKQMLQPYFFPFGWTEADAAAIFLPIWLNWSWCCSHISSYLAELKQMLQPYFFLFGWTEADAAAIFLPIWLNWSWCCTQTWRFSHPCYQVMKWKEVTSLHLDHISTDLICLRHVWGRYNIAGVRYTTLTEWCKFCTPVQCWCSSYQLRTVINEWKPSCNQFQGHYLGCLHNRLKQPILG